MPGSPATGNADGSGGGDVTTAGPTGVSGAPIGGANIGGVDAIGADTIGGWIAIGVPVEGRGSCGGRMIGAFAGFAMGLSAFLQGKAGAKAADALGETGKGFTNYIMVLGIIETVALFVMIFARGALP